MKRIKMKVPSKPVRVTLLLSAILLVFYVVAAVFFHASLVAGSSMSPTLHSNDLIIGEKVSEDSIPERGDVVTFKCGHLRLIKRVVGVPGDTLIIKNGHLFVNGKENTFYIEEFEDPGVLITEVVLSENEFFCIGDNINGSKDCRILGPVNINDIQYIVTKVFCFHK